MKATVILALLIILKVMSLYLYLYVYLDTCPDPFPPYICYNVWQGVAQHHVDQPRHITRHLYVHAPFRPDRVRDGDVIFVKTDLLDAFTKTQLPALRAKNLTLVIGHSDCRLGPEAISRINASPNVTRWLAMHMRVSQRCAKGAGIPIGLAEPDRPYGDQDLVATYAELAASESATAPRRVDRVLFPPVGISHPVRTVVLRQSRANPLVDVQTEKMEYETYLRSLLGHRWVLCPRGNGVDVHRVWEALLLRCIPVYVADSLDNVPEVFSRFPMIVVATPETLEETIASLPRSPAPSRIDWDRVREACTTRCAFRDRAVSWVEK